MQYDQPRCISFGVFFQAQFFVVAALWIFLMIATGFSNDAFLVTRSFAIAFIVFGAILGLFPDRWRKIRAAAFILIAIGWTPVVLEFSVWTLDAALAANKILASAGMDFDAFMALLNAAVPAACLLAVTGGLKLLLHALPAGWQTPIIQWGRVRVPHGQEADIAIRVA